MTPRRVLVALGLTCQIVLPTALLYAAIDPGVYPGVSLTSWASLPWMAGCLLTTAWLLVVMPWAQVTSFYFLPGFLLGGTAVAWAYLAWPLALYFTLVLIGGYLGLRRLLAGRPPAGTALTIAPPFRSGWFFVGQGGCRQQLNRHFPSLSQRYALDILRLRAGGWRAAGMFPAALDRYRIYGTEVVCPHDGQVTAVVDGLPDMEPITQSDADHIAGNHVVIHCTGADVLRSDVYLGLAHLMPGSIRVRVGDQVKSGESVARVGNSGNTTEPHLHIHAKQGGSPHSMLDGSGVPLFLGRRLLCRNDVFRGNAGAPLRPLRLLGELGAKRVFSIHRPSRQCSSASSSSVNCSARAFEAIPAAVNCFRL